METGVAGCWRVTPCSTLRRLCRAHAVGGSQRAWGQSRDTSGWPQRGAAGLQQTTRDESAAALRAQNAAAWAAWEAQAEAQGAAQRKAAQHVRETLARGAALEAAEAAAARLARQGRGRGRWAGSQVEGEGEASRASGRSSGGRRVEGWGAAGRDERDGERLAALQVLLHWCRPASGQCARVRRQSQLQTQFCHQTQGSGIGSDAGVCGAGQARVRAAADRGRQHAGRSLSARELLAVRAPCLACLP